MSPHIRQRSQKSANNADDSDKAPLLELPHDKKECQATGHENPRDGDQANECISKPNSEMMIRMRLRPGPNGPRLSFITTLREGAKKKSGIQKIPGHVENMNPEEKRRDWMRRLRPKAHRCVN